MSTTAFRAPRSRTQVYAAAALFAAVFLAACSDKPQAPPPPQVTVASVVERQIADWDEFTGHFEAVDAVDVRPRVTGFVQRVAFVEGAMVRRGDVLFVIDSRPYEAEFARAEAELERARTRKQLADMEVERAQKLVNTQAISREELDARTSGRAEGDAAIRAAEAALRVARLNLDWTVVRAPISGRVGRAEITAGNLVQGGPMSATLLTSTSTATSMRTSSTCARGPQQGAPGPSRSASPTRRASRTRASSISSTIAWIARPAPFVFAPCWPIAIDSSPPDSSLG
jgi:RND family efflux transporter MFP subunit